MEVVILVVAVIIVAGLWSRVARSHHPRRERPGDPLGLRSPREIVDDRADLEAEDLAQMLEASNARRRRRGEPERTVQDIELLVAGDRRAVRERSAPATADDDLAQLLEATEARRRARGLPERSREEVRGEWPAA